MEVFEENTHYYGIRKSIVFFDIQQGKNGKVYETKVRCFEGDENYRETKKRMQDCHLTGRLWIFKRLCSGGSQCPSIEDKDKDKQKRNIYSPCADDRHDTAIERIDEA